MTTKEKTTLRQVPQGIIATVDERPKETDQWVYIGFDEPIEIGKPIMIPNWFDKLWDKDNYHTVIATTFGWGKELVIEADTNIGYETIVIDDLVISIIDFTKPYEYTETDNQVIIKL